MNQNSGVATVQQLHQAYEEIRNQVGRVIVGQSEIVEQMVITLLAGGHALLVGVPGLAKTLMVRTLAQTLSLEFNRIQFTPDLMPSDITGIEVMHEDRSSGDRVLKFHPGPVFANLILADEINRTPPKTQAALLEAMQERQVTVGDRRHQLKNPFLVLATQNPIEQEGTYPLPEALLDRFMFEILIDYPAEDEELELVRRTTAENRGNAEQVVSADDIVNMSKLVRQVPIAEHISLHAIRMARITRVHSSDSPAATNNKASKDIREFMTSYVRWGAGPRASQYLVLAAKARAILNGRSFVSHDDIDAVAKPVLRHRIRTNYTANSEGIDSESVIDKVIEYIHAVTENEKRGPISKVLKPADNR